MRLVSGGFIAGGLSSGKLRRTMGSPPRISFNWRNRPQRRRSIGDISMTNLGVYTEKLRRFVGERGWDRFQNPKDLAMALGGEAGELLALLQWLSPEEAARRVIDDAGF